MRFSIRLLPVLPLFFAGCWQGSYNDGHSVRSEPFRIPKDMPAAPTETASRVHALGQQILAANPQVSARPIFTAIGTKESTVFHSGTSSIYISEGLVQKCRTDGELAAVLALELGKLISEREGAVASRERTDDELPLLPPRMSDVAGSSMAADMTQQAELARFQQERPRRRPSMSMPPPPDPTGLAKGYLTKAGFNVDELEHVKPLLRAAAMNPNYEKQLGGGAIVPESDVKSKNPKPQSGLGIPIGSDRK